MNDSISKKSILFQRIKSTNYVMERERLINLKGQKSSGKNVIT